MTGNKAGNLRKITHALAVSMDFKKFVRKSVHKHGEQFPLSLPGMDSVLITASEKGAKEIFQASPQTLTSTLPSPLEPLLGRGSLILLQGVDHSHEKMQLRTLFRGRCQDFWQNLFEDVTEKEISNWGQEISLRSSMQDLALKIIVKAVFGPENFLEKSGYLECVDNLLKAFTPPIMLFPFMRRSFAGLGPWKTFLNARRAYDKLVYADIEKKRRDNDGQDIFSFLAKMTNSEGKFPSPDRLRDELTTLLVAGHETTANALTWALYYIARDESIQSRLYEEISSTNHNQTSSCSLTKLPFLEAVCFEALRLHPVVPIVLRSVISSGFTLCGQIVPEGSVVGVATTALHSDPSVWYEPDFFVPERFMGQSFSPFQFIPFGGGAKKCLGFSFATLEMKVVISSLIRRYKISLKDNIKLKPVIRGITMGADKDPQLQLNLRAPLH